MAHTTSNQTIEIALPEQAATWSAAPAPAASTARTHRRSGSGGRSRLAAIARRSAVPIALVVIWQLASTLGWIDSKTLASPLQVWRTAKELSGEGELWPNVLVSLRRVVIGLAIGGAIGTLLGLVAGLSRVGEELVDAPLQMLRTLPFLGLLPLLVVWLGIGEGIKIGLVVIGVIFPIYLNLHKGIRNVDPRFAELSRSCEVGRWGMVRKVILPGALPSYLVGLRFALGIAWLSLVVGETTNAEKGIGYLIMQGEEYLRTEVIVLGLVIYALLGLCMEGIVRVIEWKTLPWHKEFVS
jgi:sulfonate transport system permease protein